MLFSTRRIEQIYLGSFHAICLVSGEISTGLMTYSWGKNQFGQLGLLDEIDRKQPTAIETLRNKNVVKVFAGVYSSYAITGTFSFCDFFFVILKRYTADGDLYSWGSFACGTLGLGACNGFVATPRKNRTISKVRSLSVGRQHVVAVTSMNNEDN